MAQITVSTFICTLHREVSTLLVVYTTATTMPNPVATTSAQHLNADMYRPTMRTKNLHQCKHCPRTFARIDSLKDHCSLDHADFIFDDATSSSQDNDEIQKREELVVLYED